MRDEPLFDWRRDGFSQRTKIEFSMGISELIKQATDSMSRSLGQSWMLFWTNA